jgi:hypothetical protein
LETEKAKATAGMDAPSPTAAFGQKRTGALDWMLFRPQSRWLRNRRRDLRTFLFLHRMPLKVDLAGTESFLRKAIIGTIAFDRADLIEWQIYLLRRYLAQASGYVVFDNSRSDSARDQIQALCSKNRVPYIGLPRNSFHRTSHSAEMDSHGSALTWACRNFIARYRPEIFGFLDHDIFPTTPCDLAAYLQSQPVYGVRLDSSRSTDVWSLWPGYCFFSGAAVSPAKLDFMMSSRFGMPTGGGNWPALLRNLDPNKLKFAEMKWLRIGPGNDPHKSFFQTIDGWIHVANASAWRKSETNRQAALSAILRSAGGRDAPTVQLHSL